MASILRPRALREGDLIAVAALSGGLLADEAPIYEHGIRAIEGLGFRAELDAEALSLSLLEPAVTSR